MFLDKFGEVIADAMTVSPSLSSIQSASAILDASNYTFQAISYGKNSDGFFRHAHAVYSPSTTVAFKALSVQTVNVSSYITSAIYNISSNFISLLPKYPDPVDTKLEASTGSFLSSNLTNIGQCMNAALNPDLSAYHHIFGCFPSGASLQPVWVFSNAANPQGSLIFSTTVSSEYNKYSLMDASGYLTIAPYNASQGKVYSTAGNYTSGVLLECDSTFSSTGRIGLAIKLAPGDAGGLAIFGGIYHLGLWCLDLKAMYNNSLSPPFSFTAINNPRKYRLVAKQTFSKDLLYHTDYLGLPGYHTYFNGGVVLAGNGVFINWDIYLL